MSYVEISDESTETSKMLTDEQQQQQQQPSTPKRDSISSKTNEDSDLNVIVLDNIDSSIFDKFQKRKLSFKEKSRHSKYSEEIENDITVIQDKLNEIASKLVYSWNNIPIIFPPSITGIDENNKFKYHFDNFFVFPTFNELDELAEDLNGHRKRLSKSQLESIKKNGEFEVESKHFPGQTHKWVLARWLQKGTEKTNKSFFQNLSQSLHLIIVTAKRRFYWKYFSILHGLKSWTKTIYNFIDVFIGLPHMRVVPYDLKLQEDLKKFLVAELVVDPNEQEKFESVCSKMSLAFKNDVFNGEKWTYPYFYLAPDNLTIDLRLFDPQLKKKIEPILVEILKSDENEKAFLNNLRDKSIIIFKNEGLEDSEIKNRTKKILFKEYMKLVTNRLLNNPKLEKISPGIGKLLAEHARAVHIIKQVAEDVNNDFRKHMSDFEANLRKKYKVKSLVNDWLNECLEDEKNKYAEKNIFIAHQRSIEKCREERLFQATYFLIREMLFYRDHEKKIISEYEKIKEPVQRFTFYRMIWFPKNYIIQKHVVQNKTSYSVSRSVDYHSDTKYPFWRWRNFFTRTWIYLCNVFFIFGIAIPFASPVSLTALFSAKPFYPGKKLNQQTGKLEVDMNSKKLTYISRLSAIWSHVSKSINKFEETPDRGLIGKNIQRIFNRIWNYVIKGFIGSVGLTAVFPPLCVVCSLGSFFLAISSPIWYPILSLLIHVGFMLIFDWDYPYKGPVNKLFRLIRIVIFDLIICGVFEPIVSLLTATILCPALSGALAIFAVVRKLIRNTWDNFYYYVVIKPNAKIPSTDTFVARRRAGPGLASSHFFQIKPEQGLAVLEAQLEIKILEAYFLYIEKKLSEPLSVYSNLFDPIFNAFSYTLSSNHSYLKLVNNVNHYTELYRKEKDRRIQLLRMSYSSHQLSQIRLSENDLNILLSEGTKMVKKHYEESISKFQRKTMRNIFDEKNLTQNDWNALTELELEALFGVGIITPLEQTDCYFSLTIDHLNLAKYSKMIADSEIRDDLDSVYKNYNPKEAKIRVQDVSETTSIFDANYEFNSQLIYPKSANLLSKITIPTKLPSHLAITTILVNNRLNAENAIDYKSFDNLLVAVNRNTTEQIYI